MKMMTMSLMVDEEDSSVRLSKRGTLKNEARTKVHLLTHRYKNPYCELLCPCQDEAQENIQRSIPT